MLGVPSRRGGVCSSAPTFGPPTSRRAPAETKVFFHGIKAFEDRGGDFEVYVAWGSDAPAKKRRAALALLDWLQF